MKKYILLSLISGMSFAAMAEGIPVLKYAPVATRDNIVYERTVKGSDKHVRVFNMPSADGYILTLGDAIVGYSTEGTFSLQTAPPAMLAMLESLSDGPEYSDRKYEAVAPLSSAKGAIMWNQDSPFNDLCPLYDLANRCPSGCVATAMAQVMYYHQWPKTGTGTHTYSPAIMNGNTLTADFENTTYNWDAMLPNYFSGMTAEGYTQAESRQAVAELLLHCGIAVDMVYYTQSGASDYDVPPAMVEYFGYDPSMAYRKREHYTTDDWLDIINAELLAGRMILAYGRASSGGHAFVFDGMDADGFIHVNWGWGGMSNGYFATSALTPASQGIGGSDGGFNYSQRIITGIMPATDGISQDTHVELTSSEGLSAGRRKIPQGTDVNIRLSGKVTNHGWQASTFDYGLLLLSAEGDTTCIIEGEKNISLAKDETAYAPNFGAINFGTIAEGTYTLYPVCRASDATGNWIRIRDSYIGYPNYLRVTATSTEVTFETPDYFKLRATSIEAPSTIYTSVPTLITTIVTNEGDVAYHGEVKAALRNGNANVATTTNYIIDLAPEDQTEIRFTDAFKVDPGNYTLVFIDDDGQVISARTDVTVKNAPLEGEMTSASQVEVTSNSAAEMGVKATVKTTAGAFHGLLYAYIYSADGKKQFGCLFPEYVSVNDNEQQEINLSGTFENGIPGITYQIKLVSYNGISYKILEDELSTTDFIFMMPDSISDIESDDDSQFIYFDVLGRQVDPNHAKTYKKLRISK